MKFPRSFPSKWLCSAFVLLLVCEFGRCLDIQVSQTAGNDVEACLLPNSIIQCRTLRYALRGLNSTDVTELRILITDDVYIVNDTIEIIQARMDKSIVITSYGGSTIMQCINTQAGIDIGSKESENSASNVVLAKLLFQNCGPSRAAVVHIWTAMNVTFTDCKFVNNTQAAINAFDSTVDILSCEFTNNSFNAHATEFFQPGVTSMSGAVGYLVTHSVNLSLILKDTIFRQNTAVKHNDNFYVSAAMNYTKYGEDGGAILVVYGNNASHCSATLDNLTIIENNATYGGGIFVATGGQSTAIEFMLTNSVIAHNTAWQSGGGICLSQWDYSQRSNFLLKNSTIVRNKSRRGGGLSAFFMSFLAISTQMQLELTDLTVKSNFAKSSSAFRFTSSLPFGHPPDIKPVFTNCTIGYHTSSFRDEYTYLAAITSQRVTLVFKGWNLIAHNKGAGGMDVESGVIHVKGNLTFANNSGERGGGLRLWSGQIRLHPGSQLNFFHNFANAVGGAMSVELFPTNEVVHEYNADCFLSYSEGLVPPSMWDTNVTFIGNGAKLKAAAIFVSSLASCMWDEDPPHYNVTNSLRWCPHRFIYKDNYLATDPLPKSGPEYDIATDTAVLSDANKKLISVKLSPGEKSYVNLKAEDELGNAVYTIAAMSDISREPQGHSHLSFDYPMHVVAPRNNNTLYLSYHISDGRYLGVVNRTHNVNVAGVYSSHNVNFQLAIQAVPCWPGYTFKEWACSCNKNISGIVRCGSEGRLVYLEEGIWGGVYNGTLITYVCPYGYCKCNREPEDPPGCKFDPEDVNSQCSKGREGILCGRCKSGLSVGLEWDNCFECSHGGWILAVVFVTVVILCIVVIYLNPGMSRDLRGPLFFFQMLPFIFVPNGPIGEIINVGSYFVEFGGPLNYFWKTCIRDGIDNLYAVAMGYVMPMITLFIFLVTYILSCKRIIRTKVRSTSNIQAFWVLMLFMYKYIVETTMRLLHCPLVDKNMVFFYDGNIQCFQGKHLVFAVIALIVLTGMVIPPPVIIVALTRGYWKVDPQYVNTLTEGLRPHCLWWWAVDLARRVLIVGIYVFIPRWRTKQLWMIIASVGLFGLHSNVHPYKGLHANLTEAVYLCVLCVLTVVQIIENTQLRDGISAFLLIIAIIHSTILLAYKSWRFFRNRCKCKCAPRSRHYRTMEDSRDIGNERLQDPEVKAKKALFDSVYASSDE